MNQAPARIRAFHYKTLRTELLSARERVFRATSRQQHSGIPLDCERFVVMLREQNRVVTALCEKFLLTFLFGVLLP
jgi:hypothetical protein